VSADKKWVRDEYLSQTLAHDPLCYAHEFGCVCALIARVVERERQRAEDAAAAARDLTPPFLGMDSFHLLAWMHEGPDPDDRARPADALIRDVWKSAHDSVLDELRRSGR
jgi:hypothetical protein